MDAEKTKRMICDEIEKITEKGLNTSNIEHMYKLIDMYKDLVTVDAMEEEGYRNAMSYGGDSYGMDRNSNKHYVRGHYSRNGAGSYNSYDDAMSTRDYAEARYSQAKMDYRNSRAGKSDVMDSLNGKMRELKKELETMSRESDFPEEREKIDKYVDMLGRLM